jgi:integrase
MAVNAQCPICRRKQSNKNKKCKECGEDLDQAKRSGRVKYFINYYINQKLKWELVGTSIEDARAADGKRKTQKRENRIFDILPDSKMNFDELTEWYLKLDTVKELSSFDRIEGALKNFNNTFGTLKVLNIKQTDLETYQEKRKKQGRAPATIDMEIKYAQTMVTKAFDNDKIDGRALKPFRRTKRKLKKGGNARKRAIGVDEYLKLLSNAAAHLQPILIVMFNTGMRTGEIRKLRWSHIDRKAMFIRLPKEITKEKRPKNIPINHHVKTVLDSIPRHLKHNFVFTYKGGPITQKDGLKRSFRTACKNAKIPCGQKTPNGITPHDFRRTMKTNMLSAGVDKAHRDMIVGHSLHGMDAIYLVENDEALRAAMDKFTKWIDKQLNTAIINQTINQKQISK